MSFVVRFVLRRLRKRRIEDLILVGSLSELGYRPKNCGHQKGQPHFSTDFLKAESKSN